MSQLLKKEALAAVTRARTRAQEAATALDDAQNGGAPRLDLDVAKVRYDRAIRDLEEAINDAGEFEEGAE